MSWEVVINWDECPYLKQNEKRIYPYNLECEHTKNRNKICTNNNCAIKVKK